MSKMMHLNTTCFLLLRERHSPMTFPLAEPLVTLLVLSLEVQIRWGSWPHEYNDPILPPGVLIEGSMAILL